MIFFPFSPLFLNVFDSYYYYVISLVIVGYIFCLPVTGLISTADVALFLSFLMIVCRLRDTATPIGHFISGMLNYYKLYGVTLFC